MMVLAGCSSAATPGTGAEGEATAAAIARPAGAVYPSVPPAGIPPVVGEGALAVLPSGGDGGPLPVSADLGSGWLATVLVATDPTRSIAVRLQVVAPEVTDLRPPESTAFVLTIDLYDAQSGAALVPASVPPAVGIRPPATVNVATVAMWRLDAPSRVYQPLPSILDGDGRVLSAWLPGDASTAVAVAMPALRAQSAPSPTLAQAQAVASPSASPLPSTVAVAASPTVSPPVSAARAPLPARLTIPSLNVNAPIAAVGLEPSGIMASPTEGHVVGWYELGPRPGEESNAILAGHVDLHKQPGVFIRLAQLQPGAIVDVDTGLGVAYRYIVDDVRSYRAADAPIAEIFGPTSKPTLTLITCGGEFDAAQRTYLDRVVVRAHGA
jgi:LPXTG-site transpeptidase (sortase) family protein